MRNFRPLQSYTTLLLLGITVTATMLLMLSRGHDQVQCTSKGPQNTKVHERSPAMVSDAQGAGVLVSKLLSTEMHVRDSSPMLPPEDTETNSDTSDNTMISRFDKRNQLLQKVCTASQYANTAGTHIEPIMSVAFDRLLLCRMAKIGSTYALRFLPDVLQETYNGSSPPSFDGQVKKYFIVREPYSRLFSAYVDKFVVMVQWWDWYGKRIIKKFRDNATDLSLQCGHDVTFSEFVKYVIHVQETNDTRHKNPHWKPMYEQCGICKDDYDYIVHLETFQDEFQYVLKNVNLSVEINLSDEEATVRDKCARIEVQRKDTAECETPCDTLGRMWWSFTLRGIIAEDIPLPIKGSVCATITGDEFANLAWDAHLRSVGHFDKEQQKRNALVKQFLSVSLQDRLKFRDLFRKDFDLFGYDPQPPDLFPEVTTY